jgi:hypothetical protein
MLPNALLIEIPQRIVQFDAERGQIGYLCPTPQKVLLGPVWRRDDGAVAVHRAIALPAVALERGDPGYVPRAGQAPTPRLIRSLTLPRCAFSWNGVSV